MSQVTNDILKKNKAQIGRFAFLYEFRFHIKFSDYNTYISVYKNHVMKVEEEQVITHTDCQTNTYQLDDIVLVEDNDFTTMKHLVHALIDQKFNKKKFQFRIYMLSNKPKLETCKYVFIFKDFAVRRLQALRAEK